MSRDPYRLPELVRPPKITAGLDALVDRGIGRCRRLPAARRLRDQVAAVEAFAAEFSNCTDARLRERLLELRDSFRRRGQQDHPRLAEGLAAVREAAHRSLGLRPFPVQVMGALALCQGYLAEMATGEGKTLTASLAAVIAGWTRRPCHVVTVNDYLAQRDATNLRPLFEFCGVSVGFTTGEMPPWTGGRPISATSPTPPAKRSLPTFSATASASARFTCQPAG